MCPDASGPQFCSDGWQKSQVGVFCGAQHGSESGSVISSWPADDAAFDLPHVVIIERSWALAVFVEPCVDFFRYFLAGQAGAGD